MSDSRPDDAWAGLQPLPSPIDVPRLAEIYSRTAAFYDEVVAERQAAAKLEALRQLDRRPGERFLEVGAGTAWCFQRLVAESGAEAAFALDAAPGMLEVARDRLPPDAASALLLADARRLPFPGAAFACLLVTYTFEVLPLDDIPAVLDTCLRILQPGGRIVIVNLTDGEGSDAAMTEDWKRRYEADPEFFGGARPLHLEPLLHAQGLASITRTYVGPDWPSEVLVAYKFSS